MKEKKVEFKPPDELLSQVGENIDPGQQLQLMTTFAVKPDGTWCIVSVEGVPFPGYDADGNPTDKEEHLDTKSEFADKYQQARDTEMPADSGGGGY